MQLRKDTDFAIRILYCVGQNPSDDKIRNKGKTVTTISRQSGVPRTVAERICRKLEAARLIVNISDEGKECRYTPVNDYQGKTVLAVVEAVEGTGEIFAVFGKNTPLYEQYGPKLTMLQMSVERVLQNMTLGTLFEAP